jgi:NTP pyrophosphatase (non-canonical NTP hydrolase)
MRQDLSDETADLLGHVLLLANASGLDLEASIKRKWLFEPGAL